MLLRVSAPARPPRPLCSGLRSSFQVPPARAHPPHTRLPGTLLEPGLVLTSATRGAPAGGGSGPLVEGEVGAGTTFPLASWYCPPRECLAASSTLLLDAS